MKKHKRIYYVPGILSLIVLPIICYYYLIPFQKDERVLEIVLPEKYKPEYKNSQSIRFDTTFLSKPRSKRKYLDIQLTGNTKDDQIKLDFFRLRIREMTRDNDTINGTHLIFGDSVKYGIFVKSLNICMEEGLLQYAAFEDNLWAFHINFRPEFIERIKKRKEESAKRYKEERITKANANQLSFREQINLYKQFWPVFFILLILTALSLRKMIKS